MWKMDEHDSFMDKLLFQMVDFLHSNIWINCPCMDTFSHYGKMLFFGGITHLLAMFGGVYPLKHMLVTWGTIIQEKHVEHFKIESINQLN